MPTLNEFPYPARDIFHGIVKLAELRASWSASIVRAHADGHLEPEESDEAKVAEVDGAGEAAGLRVMLEGLGDHFGAWQAALDSPPGCFDNGGEPDDSPAAEALRDMEASGTWRTLGVACIAFTLAADQPASLGYLEQILAGKPLTLPALDGEAVK